MGEHILEVLSTPGHTPDAISVLDRELGLLWVGDIYYDGPIWLFAPESDFDAYYQSVEPQSLYLLRKALINIQNGTIHGNAKSGGRIEYIFQGFSLIVK